MEPEPIWTKSKWKSDDLEGKTVEFRVPIASGDWSGIGKFWAVEVDDRLSVQLVTDEPGRNWAQRIQRICHLPQAAVDRIEEHPNQSVARFRLV
jgi:hypothetical protein